MNARNPLLSAAILAALQVPAAALAQSATTQLDEIVVTAQKREQRFGDVGISGTAYTGEALAEAGRRAAHRPRAADAERADQVRDGQQHPERHDPRHRPQRLRRQQQPGRRHLHRRRVPGVAGHADLRHVRPRARRGAEGPAGHAVRPQHDGRHDQLHQQEAGRRARRLPHVRRRQLRADPGRGRHRRPDHGHAVRRASRSRRSSRARASRPTA